MKTCKRKKRRRYEYRGEDDTNVNKKIRLEDRQVLSVLENIVIYSG